MNQVRAPDKAKLMWVQSNCIRAGHIASLGQGRILLWREQILTVVRVGLLPLAME